MTKIYKRPFKKAVTFKLIFEFLIILGLLWLVCRYIIFAGLLSGGPSAWAAFGVLLLLVLPVYYSILGKYFFIALDDNRIVVQNYFLPFLRVSRNYNEISKVRFWMPAPGRWPVDSIEIVKAGRKWGALFLGISMVNPQDLPNIISILKSKGVKVDVYKDLSPKEFRELDKKIRRGED